MTAPTLVYFGDSLTDNGNLYAYGEGILPDEIRDAISGPTQAVSDGPTHAAYTGDILGLDEANYAVAAAETLGTQTLEDLVIESGFEDDLLVPVTDPALQLDINLAGQLDRFTQDMAGADLSRTAALIMIGGNDFQNLDYDSPSLIQDALALIDDIIAAQIDAATALFDQGVGTVWLSELPVAEFFAEAQGFDPADLATAQLAFDVFNNSLTNAAADLALTGRDIHIAPTSAITEAIAEDPTGFGLLAPYGDTLLYSDATDSFDPDQIAFYDDIHPTTATHGVIGAFNANILANHAAYSGNDQHNDLTITTTTGTETIVFGLAGNDAILGISTGSLIAFGGSGHDTVTGALGDDLLSGGDGDDIVHGRQGDDVLNAGLGNDISRGMIGNDILIDSLGDDFLRGGKDDDIFIFTEADLLGGTDNGLNIIVGGQGYDTLYLVLSEATAVTDSLLDDLGLRVALVEDIVVLEGRAALDMFSGEAWYDSADVWGLV